MVGVIVRPHGNKGAVVVQVETDFGAERFQPGVRLWWRHDETPAEAAIVESREHDGRWIVRFEGVSSIDEAEALRGRELRIPGDALQPLGEGRFYVHDLVGCAVRTADGSEVGHVDRVDRLTGTPILVVTGRAGEVLVPLAAPICRRIDVAAKVIEIDPPEGLIELNAPARGGRGR